MKTTAKKIRKTVLSGGIVLLLGFTYLTTLTSCGRAAVTESYNKSDWGYVTEDSSSAGYDSYFGNGSAPEAEMPVKDSVSAPSSTTSGSTVQNDLSARKMIRTANLSVETKNFDEFMATLEANIFSMGGYLSSSSLNGNAYGNEKVRYANLTVRIPAETYDAFVAGIDGYGNVTYRTESVNDVTMAYVDTESRIKAYETEYQTLLEILEKATNLDDVLIIQSRITEVTYQLESYRSQLRTYDDLISYCTVHLNISEVVELTEIKEPPKTVWERMSQGLSDTWDDITDDAEDFAVDFVSALPILVIWAVILVLAVLIVKGMIKRGKKKLLVKKAAKDYKAYEASKNASDNTENK